MSIVSHNSILGSDSEAVFKAVKKAMNLAAYKKYTKGPKILLKVNLMSHQIVPGICTSPWVIESVVRILRKDKKEIFIADSDIATMKQVELAAKNWGILDICARYDTKFINLSKQEYVKVNINGKILSEVLVPRILKEVDSIITIPVLKTHNVTNLTCALKHQWGCIPNFRHQFHTNTEYVIPEINKAINVSFAITDASVCLEGNGPRVGIPRVINSIFASNDLVAMDKAMCDFIGMDWKRVPYIENAQKMGLGTTKYKFIGDKVKTVKFKLPNQSEHPIVFLEMKLRKIPIINFIVFKTPLFKIPAWIASRYNTVWYHNTQGKVYTKKIIREYPIYRKQFLGLLKNET